MSNLSDTQLEKENGNGSVSHDEYHSPKTPNSLLDANDEDVEPEVHWRTYLVVLGGSISFLTYVWTLVAFGLNQRTVAAAVGSPENYVWIQNAAQLVALVVAPPMGKISDSVGRKWLIVVGLVLGAVGLILVGAATSIGMAIAGSALLGFASGSCYILSAVVSEVLPRRLRGAVQAFFNIFAAAGGYIGATGGIKLSSTAMIGSRPGYQYALYVPAVCMFFSAVLLVGAYNPPPTPNPENRSLMARWLDFDVAGTLLLIAGITPLTIGFTWGGSIHPWSSSSVVAPLVIGIVFLIALAGHQIYVKKDGLFHHDMFKNGRNTALACIIVFVQGMFYFTYNGDFGEELQILYEQRPIFFGAKFGAFFLAQFIGYPAVGWYTKRYKAVKAPLVASFVVFASVMIALSQAKPGKEWGSGFIAAAVIAGLVYPAPECLLFVIGQLNVPPHLVGTVSSLLGSVRSLGGVIGVSVGNTILTSKINSAVASLVPAALVEAGLPTSSIPSFIAALASGDAAALQAIPGSSAKAIEAGGLALQASYVRAFPYLWYFVLPWTILAFALSCLIAPVSHQMTWVINRPVEEIHAKHAKHLSKA